MSRDLVNEIKELREELQVALQKGKPCVEYSANMTLAMLKLHVLVEQVNNSQDKNERRRLIREYQEKKKTVEKGIQFLFQQKGYCPKKLFF
jgi:hypothetical protein